jgi:hypothetical protein
VQASGETGKIKPLSVWETRCQGVVDMRVFYLNNNPDSTRDQLALGSDRFLLNGEVSWIKEG